MYESNRKYVDTYLRKVQQKIWVTTVLNRFYDIKVKKIKPS